MKVKHIVFLILLFATGTTYAQTWNNISGKNSFPDSVRYLKYRHSGNLDSTLTISPTTGNLMFVARSAGGGGYGVDSITITPQGMLCAWSAGLSTCYPLGAYYDSSALNLDSTFIYHYSRGVFVDSIYLPKSPIFGGTNLVIRDTTVTVNGNPVRGFIFDASGSGGGGGGNGISKILPGLYQLAVNDSTTKNDSNFVVIKDAFFNPGIIPFANSSGILSQDYTGLGWDGTNLIAGHNNPGILSGILFNASRAKIQAAISGMRLQVGLTGNTDPTKEYNFFNSNNTVPYLRMFSDGLGPYDHHAIFNTDVRFNELSTDSTAPTTTGTVKMLITDALGKFSWQAIPTPGSSVSITPGLGLSTTPNPITGSGSVALDTTNAVVLSRQRAIATYQTLLGFPNTTTRYLTGYGTFGSFYDSARQAISVTGTGISYNSATGVITGSGGAAALYAGFGLKKSADSTSLLADTTFGRVITSKYKGMMAYCLGDSYAQMRLYQAALKNGLGVDTTTNGVSGSTITGSTTGVASIVSRIDAALATNPDIIIIQGGSNDYILGKTIGTISSTDTLTYYGALNYIAQKCVAKTYAIKIIPVNLLQRGSSRAVYAAEKAYSDAMYQVFALYGIPVVDMFNGSGITYENMNVYSTDGIHPDRTAGIKKYGDYLVNAILTSPNVLPNISSASTGWNLTGNASTDSSINFIGTTTPNRLQFGVNGVRSGLIDWAGMNVTAIGYGTLNANSNVSGLQNSAFGYSGLILNTTGQYNTALGANTLTKNTTSSSSTAVGANALSLSTGANNTALGAGAMQNNTSGFSDVGIGTSSLVANGGGFQNTAIGMFSLTANTNGSQATAVGFNALGQSNGDFNTAGGRTALYGNSSGTNNTGLGYNVGFTNTTSSFKLLLGNEAGYYETVSNKLHIASHKEYSLINGDFSTGAANIGNLFMSTVNIVTSGTGGSLAAGNYYYYVVATDGTGESFTTQVGYTATGSTSQISLNWASVPWATSYKIYRGSSNGVYTNYFTTTGLTFTETGTTGTAGVPLAYNTAYMLRTTSTGTSIAGKLSIGVGTGTNASVGTATLVAGTVTVSTTAAATASKIFVTVVTPGGTQGFLSVPTIVNGTSFTISSTSASETSTVNWWIIN